MNDSDDDLDQDGSPDEAAGPPPRRTEGVRIIGAEEAAEAVARGDAGTRKLPDQPGYGDRPDTIDEDDDRPVLRFPTPITTRDPSSFGAVPIVRAGDPPPPDEDDDVPEPIVFSEPTGEQIAAPRGEDFDMPHYSDPPTGQVPKVVIADSDDPQESWSGLSAQPRWRGENQPFEDDDFSDLIDSGPRLGALESKGAEEFFGDDLDSPTSGFGDGEEVMPVNRRAAARTAVRRDPRPTGGGGGGGSEMSSAGRNMPAAIGVGVGLVALGIICFKLGALATTLLIAAILTLCAVEFFSTLRIAGYNPATLLGVVAVPSLAIAPLIEPANAYPIVLGLTVLAGLIWFLWVNPGPGAVGNLGVTFLGILWIGGLGSFATLLLGVGRVAEEAQGLDSNPGLGVIWGVVLVTVSYDVGAFFVGRYLGHSPLSPASPNKTVEGLLGGITAGIFVPIIILKWAPGIMPLGAKLPEVFPFCLFCALAAPLGDLCQSAVKRDLDVKDMGTLLPGHGGVLDRFDGFLFVLPVAWFMVHLLGIAPFAPWATLAGFAILTRSVLSLRPGKLRGRR